MNKRDSGKSVEISEMFALVAHDYDMSFYRSTVCLIASVFYKELQGTFLIRSSCILLTCDCQEYTGNVTNVSGLVGRIFVF